MCLILQVGSYSTHMCYYGFEQLDGQVGAAAQCLSKFDPMNPAAYNDWHRSIPECNGEINVDYRLLVMAPFQSFHR